MCVCVYSDVFRRLCFWGLLNVMYIVVYRMSRVKGRTELKARFKERRSRILTGDLGNRKKKKLFFYEDDAVLSGVVIYFFFFECCIPIYIVNHVDVRGLGVLQCTDYHMKISFIKFSVIAKRHPAWQAKSVFRGSRRNMHVHGVVTFVF